MTLYDAYPVISYCNRIIVTVLLYHRTPCILVRFTAINSDRGRSG